MTQDNNEKTAKDTANGGQICPLEADLPDDAIVVDLTEDEESLNWMQYGPEDEDKPFREWSEERVQKRLERTREKLRENREEKDSK